MGVVEIVHVSVSKYGMSANFMTHLNTLKERYVIQMFLCDPEVHA